jgi:hypothetical protein
MLVLARIILPFTLRLIEKVSIELDFEGERVLIYTSLSDGTIIHSYQSEDMSWIGKKGDNVYEVEHIKLDESIIKSRKIIFSDNEEKLDILEGNIDFTRFTSLNIVIPSKGEFLKADDIEFADIKIRISQILVFFLNSYRIYTKEVDVYVPTRSAMPSISYYTMDNYQYKDGSFNGKLNFLARVINFPEHHEVGLLKNTFKKEEQEDFARVLSSSDPAPAYYQLLGEAKYHELIREDYKLAIILAATAFEVYIQTRLIQECEHRNIKKIYLNKNSQIISKGYEEVINNGNIREDLLGLICKQLTSSNAVKGSREFQQWYDYAYEVRNKIIHRGKYTATKDEAKAAIDAVLALANYVDKSLLTTR